MLKAKMYQYSYFLVLILSTVLSQCTNADPTKDLSCDWSDEQTSLCGWKEIKNLKVTNNDATYLDNYNGKFLQIVEQDKGDMTAIISQEFTNAKSLCLTFDYYISSSKGFIISLVNLVSHANLAWYKKESLEAGKLEWKTFSATIPVRTQNKSIKIYLSSKGKAGTLEGYISAVKVSDGKCPKSTENIKGEKGEDTTTQSIGKEEEERKGMEPGKIVLIVVGVLSIIALIFGAGVYIIKHRS